MLKKFNSCSVLVVVIKNFNPELIKKETDIIVPQRHKRFEVGPRTEANSLGQAAGPTPEEGNSPAVGLPRADGRRRVVGEAGEGSFSGSNFHVRRGQATKTVAGIEVSFLSWRPSYKRFFAGIPTVGNSN